MKKIDTSKIVSGVRKLGAIKQTLDHFQESYIEVIANLVKGLIAGATAPVAIWGVVNSGSGSTYNISAGAIWHNGEVFDIDAFAGTAAGGQVPVLSLVTTWRAGDPVKYSDGSTQNTHSIRKYVFSFAASGSGLADFSEVVTLKQKVLNDLLAAAPLASPAFTGVPTVPTAALGTNTTQAASTAFVKAALDALIASAPGALDTLDELAAALGDDANFAATITTALAGKVPTSRTITAGSGLTGGGDLTANRTLDVNVDDSTIEISSNALRLKDGGVSTAKLADESVTTDKVSPLVFIGANWDASTDDLDDFDSRSVMQLVTGSNPHAPTATSTDRFFLINTSTQFNVAGLFRRVQIAIQISGASAGAIYVREFLSSWSSWSLINS